MNEAAKYENLIAFLLTSLFAPLIGKRMLGLYIDLDNIFLSSALVCIFILLLFFLFKFLANGLTSLMINQLSKRKYRDSQ